VGPCHGCNRGWAAKLGRVMIWVLVYIKKSNSLLFFIFVFLSQYFNHNFLDRANSPIFFTNYFSLLIIRLFIIILLLMVCSLQI
jgi:hypothetical protein